MFFATCVVGPHAYVFGLVHHIGCAAKISGEERQGGDVLSSTINIHYVF
jgi:hypothetical protein